MTDEQAFAWRLAQLRIQAGVSARDMSLSMGQSQGYINKIENMQNLPSMSGFFYICEYLGITPMEFFDYSTASPSKVRRIVEQLKGLTDKQLDAIITLLEVMGDNQNQT